MIVLFGLLLTVGVYVLSKRLYRQFGSIALSPLIICPVVLIGLLVLLDMPFEQYNAGGSFLSFMLQPATVALAVPMYKYRDVLKKYAPEIIIGVGGGAIVAIITSVGLAQHLGLSQQLAESLAPRSITTPMAISVSEMLGGDPAITAVFVIMTGVSGVVLTSLLLKYTQLERPITKGMLYGIVAHGTGTARAYEAGPLEGAIASLAMIFMGIVTTVLAPVLVPVCFSLFG